MHSLNFLNDVYLDLIENSIARFDLDDPVSPHFDKRQTDVYSQDVEKIYKIKTEQKEWLIGFAEQTWFDSGSVSLAIFALNANSVDDLTIKHPPMSTFLLYLNWDYDNDNYELKSEFEREGTTVKAQLEKLNPDDLLDGVTYTRENLIRPKRSIPRDISFKDAAVGLVSDALLKGLYGK